MKHQHQPRAPHTILGIPSTASVQEAERAWKRLARSLHPDRHPPEEREALGIKMAEVNAAWSAFRAAPTKAAGPKPYQHAVYYTPRDPMIADALDALLHTDSRAVRGAWLKSLLRGRLPKRARPLSVVLCSAVVAEGRHVTLLFEAPLPKGRCAILIPTLRWTGGHLTVQPERPKSVDLHTPSGMVGQFSPFSREEVQAAGLESLAVMFPSRPLDITKTVRLSPPAGLSRLFYQV